jgi:hypothetical protein
LRLRRWCPRKPCAGIHKPGNPSINNIVFVVTESSWTETVPDSRDLIVRPTNLLSQASRAKTDWELLVTIANGALFTPMHDFRGKLTDEQMLDVMAYIRSVAPFDRVS